MKVTYSSSGHHQDKKIVELNNNVVRDYLKEHPTQNLSVKYLKNKLKLKRSRVLYYCLHSNHIERVAPHEVGSYKHSVSVFRYKK